MNTYSKAVLKFGHFINSNLEMAYRREYIKKEFLLYKYLLPVAGILNCLFIFPDYYNLTSETTFIISLLLRIAILALSLLMYFRADTFFSPEVVYKNISLYEVIFVSSFLLISAIYNPFSFTIQYFGLITLLLGVFFVIPNSFLNKVILAVIFSIPFFIISSYIHNSHLQKEFYPAIIFTILFITLASITSYRNACIKRRLFFEHRKYENLASTDTLTNIYNRRKFDEELKKEIILARRYNRNLSLILIDLDYFKRINDSYGHVIGDKVLFLITKIINSSIREVDIFARVGGEEFAILMPHKNQKEALILAERLRKKIADKPYEQLKGATCSFGIGQYTNGDSTSFFEQVDKALYKAKRAGRNQVIINKPYT